MRKQSTAQTGQESARTNDICKHSSSSSNPIKLNRNLKRFAVCWVLEQAGYRAIWRRRDEETSPFGSIVQWHGCLSWWFGRPARNVSSLSSVAHYGSSIHFALAQECSSSCCLTWILGTKKIWGVWWCMENKYKNWYRKVSGFQRT